MNRDQIIQMARDAGATEAEGLDTSIGDVRLMFKLWPEELERFAAAIRAATKEEDARICDAKKEKAFDEYDRWFNIGCSECADAIRASK